MNLVKAQALASDLPIPELQKYANGFDPRIIPPWIATGTLQARMDINKRMQNMMGGVQGEQPSVKEQIEQKAGLMAAQAMQQQQAQQQMMQRPQPGPTPENIPQPEPQPEESMMARGGLAKVPMQFAFKPGGIVGYAEGGDVDAARAEAQQALANLRSYSLVKRKNDPQGFEAAEAAVRQAQERLQAAQSGYEREMSSSEVSRPAMNLRDVGRAAELRIPAERAPEPMATRQGPADPMVPRRAPEQGIQAARPPQAALRRAQPMPQQTAPQAMPTGLPAAAQRSPYFAQAESSVNAPIEAPTAQGIIAEQTALSPAAMQESAMQRRYEERRARADQEREAFNKSKPSGLDDLIRVFGQAGQYKGLTGLGPAYTANQKEKRDAEMAMLRRQNELYTAADTQEYEGAKDLYGARAGAMKQAIQSYQDRLKSRSETLAKLAGVDQRRIDEQINRLTQFELQKLRSAESARGTPDQQLFAQFLKLKADGKEKEAKNLLDSLDAFKGAGRNQEDTMAKKLAAAKVAIASSMTPQKMKDEQLAGIAALEKQLGIGGGGGGVPTTKAQYDALPKGASYTAPDGTTRIKG
jgi:hypothetical protein